MEFRLKINIFLDYISSYYSNLLHQGFKIIHQYNIKRFKIIYYYSFIYIYYYNGFLFSMGNKN